MRSFLILLVFMSAAFAACNGTAWHYLPAVVGDQGVLVNMSLVLESGSGDLFMSVYPRMGLSIQQSARDAENYAFRYVGEDRESCDVRIKAYMPASTGTYLDGPSGGAALTVMGISALEGRPIRADSIITGAIGSDGSVEPVGGLYEKGKIAQSNGIRYFITPVQNLYERILLRMLQESGNMTVLEAQNMSEAAGFLIDGKNISTERKPPRVQPVNASIAAYAGSSRFAGMAQGMMGLFQDSVQKVDAKLKSDEMLDPYFSQIEENERILYSKGYYFSAANDAFLAYIDSETIANVNNLDVNGKENEVRSCLASAPLPALNENNIEWFAGAELREGWAQKKLDDMSGANYTLREEKYLGYHDAMYGDAWCNIAKMLEANAPTNGKTLDENALRNLSADYLKTAEDVASQSQDSDVLWHLENAQQMHDKGEYAGSILDSVFAIEIENASSVYAQDEESANLELPGLANGKRSSLWGEVYASHGNFVLQGGDNETAYGLLRFAKGR
ncbi:MAG: hypothetical protein PHS02_02060, partial [Candidatus ainarchaeum sp.]|nr:hypothetical protein [Candidatus ainarchaeum sp.]